MDGYFNVKDFGAKGDGLTDDTQKIKDTIAAAKASYQLISGATKYYGTVYFPPGVYRVSSEITVTNGEFYGCKLEGANAEAVKIIPLPSMTGNSKVFKFRGGSGAFSNVGIKNMTIGYEEGLHVNPNHAVGIYIDGQCFAIFENIRLKNLKYGIWLHNDTSKSFSELNQFHQLQFSYCQNGVRIEQGVGSSSFHGNDFNNCYFNIGAKQIGFNHQSGYLYNARFRLFMWAHSKESTYINADGNATDNIGDITYESFQKGKITGKGRFWFNGFFRGIPPDGVSDETQCREPWQKVFACDNYWKPSQYDSSGMHAGPLKSYNNSFNGPQGFFQSLHKDKVNSVVLNTYSGSDENGLYLGRSGYQQALDKAQLGMFLSSKGDKIKSYHQDILRIESLKGIELLLGGARGYKFLAGSINFASGKNNYIWQDVITFKSFIGGRLISVDGNGREPVCSIIDISWNSSDQKTEFVSEVFRNNKDRQEHLRAQFSMGSEKKLQIGANFENEADVQWYFNGVII